MTDSTTLDEYIPSSYRKPKLKRAFRRGQAAGAEGERIPRPIRNGCRDVHAAWLEGYMHGVTLTN